MAISSDIDKIQQGTSSPHSLIGNNNGHTILDDIGTTFGKRSALQFIGADVTDDVDNDRTKITITSAGGNSSAISTLTLQIEVDTINIGNLCYKSTDGWHKTNCSNSNFCSGLLGIKTASGVFLISGKYLTSNLTIGTYYVGSVSGVISLSEPVGVGEVSRIIGYAISSTELLFNPSDEYFTIGENTGGGSSTGELDGGSADSVYLPSEVVDGGVA